MKKTFTVYAILATTTGDEKKHSFSMWDAMYDNNRKQKDAVIFTGSKQEVEFFYNQLTKDNTKHVELIINDKKYRVYGYGCKRFYNPVLYPNRKKAPVGLINQNKNYKIVGA